MTRTVRDGAILLGALTGVDQRDPATNASRQNGRTDYTQFLQDDGLRGARLGVVRSYFGFHERVDHVMEDAVQAIRDSGADIVDEVELPTQQGPGNPGFELMLYEFKAGLNAYLAALGPTAPIRTLADAIRFNEDSRDREMPYFGQEIFLAAQEKGALSDRAYRDAMDRVQRVAVRIRSMP